MRQKYSKLVQIRCIIFTGQFWDLTNEQCKNHCTVWQEQYYIHKYIYTKKSNWNSRIGHWCMWLWATKGTSMPYPTIPKPDQLKHAYHIWIKQLFESSGLNKLWSWRWILIRRNTWWLGVPALIAEKGWPWTYIAEKDGSNKYLIWSLAYLSNAITVTTPQHIQSAQKDKWVLLPFNLIWSSEHNPQPYTKPCMYHKQVDVTHLLLLSYN